MATLAESFLADLDELSDASADERESAELENADDVAVSVQTSDMLL